MEGPDGEGSIGGAGEGGTDRTRRTQTSHEQPLPQQTDAPGLSGTVTGRRTPFTGTVGRRAYSMWRWMPSLRIFS